MNILLTLDENYLLPCKVMLDSLFASNPAETDVTVYLLHSAIPCGEAGGAGVVLRCPRRGAEAHRRGRGAL